MPLGLKSFRKRVFFTFTLPVIVIILSSIFLIVFQIAKHQKNLLKSEFLSILTVCGNFVEKNLANSQTDFKSEFDNIMKAIPALESAYILAREENENFVIIARFSAPDKQVLSEGSYPSQNFPGIMLGYAVPVIVDELHTGKKSNVLIGYFPIRDEKGTPVCVLKMDFDVKDRLRIYRKVFIQIFGTGLFLIILVIIFGFYISYQISKPVTNLIEGIQNIQRGNLNYRIPVNSNDEFGNLARIFNQMTTSLLTSRTLISGYLYRTIRSFVKILEARDSYTKGHSERVAFFCELIAKRMGLPEKKIKLLKDVALLHDIGKFGIGEDILQKKEPLTEQEWDIIKKHPVIGEEILRPVFLEKDALEIVRQHHERFDGKGYPDGLEGNQINIMAQILSVADAYDAMISARIYRQPMNKEEAIKELKENSGTQFNPDVVKAFEDEIEKIR